MPGVTDLLLKDGAPFQTTTSSITGTYSFDGLGPGNYTVIVDTTDTDIPGGYFPSTNNIAVTLGVGENRTDIDFPFVQLINKQVSKTKADPGDTLYYSITVNYPGSELLSNVTVTDLVPTGTTFLAANRAAAWAVSPLNPVHPATIRAAAVPVRSRSTIRPKCLTPGSISTAPAPTLSPVTHCRRAGRIAVKTVF